ncbi:protein JOKA2 isoform X1 [Primulina eburnea]|uniref:protein JOKA2 isoform X1 n=1 Tax=Primulina eburnea TaxID=1245227 RepID=UPI003C6C0F3A
MEASTLVIKVKYGDILRRFNAKVLDGELDCSMGGLTEKIFSLFKFAPDTEIILSYIDEDGDSVALVDDDDLCDVVKQSLNPLRITVKLSDEKNGTPISLSTGNSTPLRSPRVEQSFQNPIAGVSEILKTVPEPLRETLVNLSTDLLSKASSTAPGICPVATGLVNYFSKVGLSYLDQLAEAQIRVQPSAQSDVPESSSAVPESKDSDSSRIDPKITVVPSVGKSEKQPSKSNEIPPKLNEATAKIVGFRAQNLIGESINASSSKAPETSTVAGALNSKSINVGQLEKSASENTNPRVVHLNVGKKEKAKMINDCNLDVMPHLTRSNQPPVANPGIVVTSDPLKGNSPNGRTRCVFPSGFENPQESLLSPNPGSFHKFPDSSFTYEFPFSGISVENVSAAPPKPVSLAAAFNRSRTQNDGCGTIFHRGVRCDLCGVHPITGPRFKSKVKADYDLCSICFAAMGNENDYFRIDYPAINRHQWAFKGFHDHHARGWCPASPQIHRGHKVKPGRSKLDSRFIQDVNILDGTAVAPLTPFTKIWRMRNNGTVAWPQKAQLVWIGGDKLSDLLSVELEIPATGLAVDHELDVAVDFVSPDLPGRYISYWRMASPSGQKFGQRVWVLIQVDATLKETPRVGVQGLNLNLPPVNSVLNGPEIVNVDLTPLVEDSRLEPDNSNRMMEIVDPVFNIPLPNNEQEMKFPITDSLLVGNGASSSALPAPTFEKYPIIDLSDIAPPAFSTPTPFVLNPSAQPVGNKVAYTKELPEKEEVESKLLRELEQMGFKQVDLNKEILRMNEYDLEQAVDDLCDVAQWDPLLDELQEMGFYDTEMNKKLLKKNNGSIKRVVMDLVAGEEKQ